jgi:cation diffusion facilitator CzcD-associated flavoprotein CzcO
MQWDASNSRWNLDLNGGDKRVTAWNVVLCTGFASKAVVPPYKGIDSFNGDKIHTSRWPQQGYNTDDKRVAIIGTGATGVQAIQEVSKTAGHLTVFQRTANTALPMQNPHQDAVSNKAMRDKFPQTSEKMMKTFAGFDYEFDFTKPEDVSKEDRMKLYEKLYHAGGLQFWLGTYMNILYQEEYNEEAYQFWRSKVLPRIKDKKNQEILAPAIKQDPFGTKRISLEKNFFECFNQDNVEVIDLRENSITEFTPEGIKTSDGNLHELDVVVFATGFDSITGGVSIIFQRMTV